MDPRIYNSYQKAKNENPTLDIYAACISMNGKESVYGTEESIKQITSNYYLCNHENHTNGCDLRATELGEEKEKEMKTYNTYQEAKIANPECEVAVVSKVDTYTPRLGEFIAVVKSEHSRGGYSYTDKERTGNPNVTDGYYTICKPADHCMTVERFLANGYKLTSGDVCIVEGGSVVGVTATEHWNLKDELDGHRYILRAAALEEKEPELTRDDSPQGIISAISNRLHNIGCEHQESELGEELSKMACDIWGVLPLISNESIEEQKISLSDIADINVKHYKKPRTKVGYVKVEYSKPWEIVKLYDEGVGLFKTASDKHEMERINSIALRAKSGYDFYRQIETPIEWWEDAAEFVKPIDSAFTEFSGGKLQVEAAMTRDQWCDFARILLEQGE